MRLLVLLLIFVVIGSVLAGRRRRCGSNRDCKRWERCVIYYSFWWRSLGVCKPKRCEAGSDCGPSECCVTPQKKKGQVDDSYGICQPLQTSGNSCLMGYPAGQPTSIVQQCPCEADLECISDGTTKGETGVCGVPQKSCTSGADCGPNECCDSTAQLKGRKKRQIGGNEGVCKPLQTNGGVCLLDIPSGKPAETVLRCPCTLDLRCVADGNRIIPDGYTGVCGPPVSCSSGADCNEYECCEALLRPFGRKKRQLEGGVCKHLGTPNESCLTRYTSGKPDGSVFACPCLAGLTCNGTGVFDVPLGEKGTCV